MSDEITQDEAYLLERFGPLEMARLIISFQQELRWISHFADVRSKDDSKTFARVNRGALRTINQRASDAMITEREKAS